MERKAFSSMEEDATNMMLRLIRNRSIRNLRSLIFSHSGTGCSGRNTCSEEHRDTETRKNRINGEDKSPNRRVTESPNQPKIGIPYIFFYHDYLPFWTTLLWELGFDIEVSPKTNRQIVNLGLESVLAETCFPAKVAQ